MRILNIIFESVLSPLGGLGVFVRDSMIEVGKSNDVTVLGYDPLTIEYANLNFNGYRVINCKNTNIHQSPRGPFHLLTLNDMMTENLIYHFKNEKFDIIHLHDTLLWSIAKYAAILTGGKIVTHIHLSNALVHKNMPFIPQRKYEVTQEAHAYMMSNRVITCSNNYKDKVKDHFMIDRHIDVVPNGVNFDRLKIFHYDKKLNYEVGHGKQVIGFVGRMVPSKGIKMLLKAVKRYRNKHFVIISNVAPTIEKFLPLVKDITKLVKTHNNITWYRDLKTDGNKKWNLMASCDLAVVPSLHEPWGIVADEWSALKVDKIVTNIDGLSEHCSSDDSILINPNEKEFLKSIRNYKVNMSRVDNAYNKVKDRTWEKVAQSLVSIYKEVLNGNRET